MFKFYKVMSLLDEKEQWWKLNNVENIYFIYMM